MNSELEIAEIVKVSAIHGELPGCVDVSVRNHSMIRVALDWKDVTDKGELTDSATAKIEAGVKKKGGFDEVNWNC